MTNKRKQETKNISRPVRFTKTVQRRMKETPGAGPQSIFEEGLLSKARKEGWEDVIEQFKMRSESI